MPEKILNTIAELVRDKQRLDRLEQANLCALRDEDNLVWIIRHNDNRTAISVGNSLRQAIDNAERRE